MEYLLILGLTMLWQKETKIFFIPFLVVVILKRYIMYWYYYWLYNISHYDYMCMLLVSTKNMCTKAKIELYLFVWNFLPPADEILQSKILLFLLFLVVQCLHSYKFIHIFIFYQFLIRWTSRLKIFKNSLPPSWVWTPQAGGNSKQTFLNLRMAFVYIDNSQSISLHRKEICVSFPASMMR